MTGTREGRGVAGVLLAAGAGRRFGGDKLVAPLEGVPLVRHAAALLRRAGLAELVVVVPPSHEAIADALDGLGARLVPNPRAAEGMGTSVAAGIAALGPDVRAALVALGDQPHVPEAVVHALVQAWRATGTPIVAPRYAGGVRGNPVLFDAGIFAELLRLEGDEGARGIIARAPSRVRLVDFPFAMPADVDTPEALEALEPPAE